MKKRTLNLSLAALLLSSTVFTTFTALEASAAPNKTVSKQTTKVSSKGPINSKEIEAFMDPIFAEKMKKHNVNGSNFVLVKDGKVLVNKGYGYADKEKKTLVDKDTVFQIASVSKTFTALAALQLVEKGKMDLNRDINEYLGGMKIPNKTNKPLTLNDLLTYTTGFDFPDISTDISPEMVYQDIPMREYMTEHMPTVVRTPGEAYTYDNYAFLLAGYAVQTVSGIPFNQYMENNVFKPLGMGSTSVRFTPELLSRMATHYDPDGKPHPAYGFAPTDGGQGSILSTGDDMAKYLSMFQQQGTVGGKEIISRKTAKQMQTYSVFAIV